MSEPLESRITLDASVVFNEIMYHPPRSPDQLEWVELHNQMAVDMDISAWRLTSGISYKFPEGTIVPGGGYVVIAKNPAALLAGTGVEAMGPFTGSLANAGEELTLRDRNDREMDRVEYNDRGDWPVGPDGSGVSLARRDPNTQTDRAASWASSVVIGGTPGRRNFGNDPSAADVILTLIDGQADWRYDGSGNNLGVNWRNPAFNDSSWSTGTAPFYAGDARLAGSIATMVGGTMAAASSSLPGLDPSHVVDGSGIAGNTHVADPHEGTMWLSAGNLPLPGVTKDLNPEITFDLGAAIPLESMRVWNFNHADTATCCTNQGIARADILVAGEDGVFRTLIEDQSFDRAPGTATDFSQAIDLQGTVARYVRIDVDTTNGIANWGDPFGFVGLSEVQFFTVPPPGNTELNTGPVTHYFRKEFEFSEDPARTDLQLDLNVDDGAIVYLNGTEIYRVNMPPGNVAYDTPSLSEIGDPAAGDPILLPATALVRGSNVLAVEVHQSRANDTDMFVSLGLTSITAPPEPLLPDSSPVVINELAAAASPTGFFVEVTNRSDQPFDLSGVELVGGGFSQQFGQGTSIAPGELVVVPVDANRAPSAGQAIYVYDATKSQLLDSMLVMDQGRGRQGASVLFTQRETPGTVNQFQLQHDVVINEIMYHHRAITAGEGGPVTRYAEVDEEWIELFNRGTQEVDLSGWRIRDAVDYRFPAGTRLAAGSYLVIANDAAELRGKYPQIANRILGDFTGNLSNRNDRIVLLDQTGNPADTVEYFESGDWPNAADGNGSSLELTDPDADNSSGTAWAASVESDDSPWRTYTYRGTASASTVGPDGRWEELVLGLLSDGEILLDDIRVVESPSTDAIQLIQNSTFEQDTPGQPAAKWRTIGTHRHSEVIVDPDDPSNQVLRFVATDSTEHMHNHAETTLKDGENWVRIRNGREYEISFRAKWITGSNQLNSRLYFNRLPQTTAIETPLYFGTPGQPNSTLTNNAGPTYAQLQHSPVVPDPSEPVTVSIVAADADGVAALTLWYAVDSGAWAQVPMSSDGARFRGTIPPQSSGAVVQFYVTGSDTLGATSAYPAAGPDSRALYQVNDERASDTGLHNFRIIMTPADRDLLHSNVELMSNDPMGTTVIYDESEVFYDAGVRLSGSQRARPYQPRLAFAVRFNADHLFRGVYGGIILDRSESTGFGQREHIYHQGMSHAGGLPSEYNDLFHIITPLNAYTGGAEAQLARYSDIYLDAQYENGSEGQLYEYELVYFPTTAVGDPREGRKLPQPDEVVGMPIRYRGDNQEGYRWTYLNKNNLAEDDYSQLIEFMRVMSLNGAAFHEQIGTVIDVDQWLRAFAFSVITGHGDNYGSDGSQHNLQLYVRPSDNRVLFFPHDLDAFFDATRPLVANSDLTKLIQVPGRRHMYYGHVHDMIQTTFNEQYMKHWTDLYRELLPRQRFDSHLRDLVRRSDNLTSQLNRAAPPVDFSVVVDQPDVDTSVATIRGDGWINVREIRLQGSLGTLNVEWTDVTKWQAQVPLAQGTNSLVAEAYDFQGNRIASVPFEIRSTAANPVGTSLTITELDYNPSDPTPEELAVDGDLDNNDFEFVELINRGDLPLNLMGVHFSNGIDYTFPAIIVQPQETIVLVKDAAAFRLRYGDAIMIAGEFSGGRLSNEGEQLTLLDGLGNTVFDFTYDDDSPWPTSADGDGKSLTRTDLAGSVQLATSWTASHPTPGSAQLPGDLNLDRVVDIQDVDLLCAGLRNGTAAWDLNGDGVDDNQDLDYLIGSILNTSPGDADLDGVFNSADFIRVFLAGEYEDDIVGNSTWAEGDWNCDGEFSSGDFVVAFLSGKYSNAARARYEMEPETEMLKDLARFQHAQYKQYASALYDAQSEQKGARRFKTQSHREH